LEHNEISFNNTHDWERHIPGCGCTGGGKFWYTDGATVVANWVHDNHGPGLWADTDNNDFDFEGNYISRNDAEGIEYEISYNALIRDNTFVRNALVAGPHNPGFPTPAVYLSESGGDARVPARFSMIRIVGNRFVDNWSGVVLWENADRFCGSPANTSTGYCTLVRPRVINRHTCVAGTIKRQPYYSGCRWRTRRVLVAHNDFVVHRAEIRRCTAGRSCGLQGIFSNYGSYPSWSPYKGERIERAITFHQQNVFRDNHYTGAWRFMVHDQGRVVGFHAWRSAPYHQDRGSTARRPR
jgi:parallel beta-helix repeat protein